VSAEFASRRTAGPFRAGGAVQADKTGLAVSEILSEVRAMRDREVTDEELVGAKTFLLNSLRRDFERVEWTAGALTNLINFELPLDEWQNQAALIGAVRASDVRRVANTYLHPETMRILVVGDRATVEPQLVALGLGPIQLCDVYGKPLASAVRQ
jgi:zinc protease